MAIKRDDIAITGTQGGLTAYISKGINIFRKTSSLTGRRVKKDPAFAGFRESGNRMKAASPIASSLYGQLPAEKKEFRLYRLLTGEAIKMIKNGIEKAVIRQTLHDRYIAPLLEPVISSEESSDRKIRLEKYAAKNKIKTTLTTSATMIQLPEERISTSRSDLIYLGRVKGWSRLKIWLRPTG
ncbi:MAG TPA: hypothetical protein VG890_15300 [Puia sp.]|nr:hypothetical protein [Puia sp.]